MTRRQAAKVLGRRREHLCKRLAEQCESGTHYPKNFDQREADALDVAIGVLCPLTPLARLAGILVTW